MPLEVHITDPGSIGKRTLRFSKSPVRIGRNQLNDISLQDRFVSEWHGIIRFDDQGVAYFDLGSTNGSMLNRARLPKNVPAALSHESQLQLGLFTLTVSHELGGAGFAKTMGWGQGAATPRAGGGALHSFEGPPTGPGDSSGQRNLTRLGLSESAPPASGLPGVAGQARSPGQPTTGPALPGGSSDVGSEAAESRFGTLLEVFSEAFVGLRKGYEQFGAEVGIRVVNGSTPLHRARTSREVMDYLLAQDADPQGPTQDLMGIFADFAIHHIAMMEGITEGVRALLQSLDPRANDLETSPRLLATAKTKLLWKSYLERFDQMITEDEPLHAAIFGEDFARAYASVTLGNDGPKARR